MCTPSSAGSRVNRLSDRRGMHMSAQQRRYEGSGSFSQAVLGHYAIPRPSWPRGKPLELVGLVALCPRLLARRTCLSECAQQARLIGHSVPIAGTCFACATTTMSDIDRDMCRKAAAECVELARATSDPAKKEILITRAQEWLKLAYARSETEFTRLVAGNK